jgi:acyl-coenzyme A synthetase/AMP-(fatty) acid ligase
MRSYTSAAHGGDATTGERLREHARDRPGVAAIVSGDRTLDYATLATEVARLAAAMAANGLGPGTVVGLVLRDEVEHLLATLALLECGAMQISLPSREPAAARERLARRVGATTVLVDRDEDAPPGLRPLCFADLHGGRAGVARNDDAEAPAVALTGSGTSGEPKLIVYSGRDLARQAARTFDFTGQRVLRPAHVEFNNSKRIRLYALWQGGTSVLANGSTEAVGALCARHGVTRLELSSMHAANLVAASARDGPLPPAVHVRVGGSRLPWPLRRAFLERVSPHLHVSYGTTETSVVAVAGPDEHDAREAVGRPVRDIEVSIVDDAGAPVAAGGIGEIRLRTAGMARGYVGDPAATARAFRDGWFVPGDRVSLDADGLLVVHGRSDDMMIMNGINIFPLEIERVLETHPAVGAAAALPLASAAHGQIPVAAVELRPGASGTAAELLRYARGALGMRAPRRVVVLDALPRNAAGKILRRDIAPSFDVEGRSHG